MVTTEWIKSGKSTKQQVRPPAIIPVLKFVPRRVGGMEFDFDPCSSVSLKQDRFFPLQKGADGCMSEKTPPTV